MKPKRSEKCEREMVPYKSLVIRAASDSSARIEPLPMKDKKPVPRHPTAADSFWSDHQAEYDSRGQTTNRCGYVDSHNDASPKLKDELEKRRDVSKPIACQTKQYTGAGCACATQTLVSERDWSNPDCIMCSVRRKHGRYLSSRNATRHRRYKNSRICKQRRRRPRRIMTVMKALSCQPSQNLGQTKSRTSKSDVGSYIYPDTSPEPSLTSYPSNMSLSHEPMG